MSVWQVALCELSAAECKFLDIVSSTPRESSKNVYKMVSAAILGNAQIAVVEANSPSSMAHYRRLKLRNPKLEAVFLSSDGSAGEGEFRIPQRYLLVQITRLLDQITLRLQVPNLVQHEIVAPKPVLAQRLTTNPAGQSQLPSMLAQTRSQHNKLSSIVRGNSQVSKMRALVCDDSAAARAQLRGALESMNFEVVEADCAETALTRLKEFRFNLALLDVSMPGLSGFELCSQIKHRSEYANLPVVMVTARNLPFDRARGVFSRCDAYLSKPMEAQKFDATIKMVLQKYQQNAAVPAKTMLQAAMINF